MMMSPEFTPWPSIPRLFRDVTVTEKIDGTNAAVGFAPLHTLLGDHIPDGLTLTFNVSTGHRQGMWVQSRSRIITPDMDNYGFAKWCCEHGRELYDTLGEGLHYGEWWGSGVNRGYGLEKGDKRFSLFNTKRWAHLQDGTEDLPGLYCVPVLWEGAFAELVLPNKDTGEQVLGSIQGKLQDKGSAASPGYANPEGIVVFHHAANHCFKFTFDGDGHKGVK